MGFLHSQNSMAKSSSDSGNYFYKRIALWSASSSIAVGTHVMLYKTWYSKYNSQPFTWINDSKGWNQMDKFGHFFSAYSISAALPAAFRFAGYSQKKSAWIGAAFSLAFQTPIEYFDGKSDGWGASATDLLANTGGAAAGFFQQYFWGEIKIPITFTFRQTPNAAIRPNVLGHNVRERMLKDYNGQIYWVNLIPHKLMQQTKGPKWLGISIGYGSNGMLGSFSNVWVQNGITYDYSQTVRYRQFFIGPTLSFSHLHPKNKFLRALCRISDHIRLPLPVFEFNKPETIRFHPIYW